MSKSVPRRSAVLRSAATLGLLLSFGVTQQPAVAAMTETYYQRAFPLSCGEEECAISLPKVAANTRLNIRQVSCGMVSTGKVLFGTVAYQYSGNDLVKQYMAPTVTGQKTGLFFQEMDILVPAQKLIGVSLVSDAPAVVAYCTLTGRLQKFS